MTVLRPTPPKIRIGDPYPHPLIAEMQPGRVYAVRWAANTEGSFGLDASGLGIHARITRTNAAQACSPSPIGNVSMDTDLGNRVVYYPTAADVHPIEMPYWDIDLDRGGIWIPRGMSGQVAIVGGDPSAVTVAWPVYTSHELAPGDDPPPLELTYAAVPAGTTIYLVDRPAARGAPLPVIPADVHGCWHVRTPMNAPAAGVFPVVTLNYDDPASITQTITAYPGVPISTAGAVSVTCNTGGQYVFGVRL